MTDTNPELVAVLEKAKALIEARGYQPIWGHGGPLNLSQALSTASTTYDLYAAARQVFSNMWGGPIKGGLLGWETYKRRTQSEVLELLDEVIRRVKSGEAQPKTPTTAQRRAF